MGEQSETQRFPWGALCKGPRQRTQEMMSLPSNRTQQNQEPRYPGLHSGEKPPARSLAAKMFCCLPLHRGRRLRRAHRQSVWECGRCWLRAPPRGFWPFARRNRKVTREPQAGLGHLSHPTRVTLSPFPVSVDGGFSGCVGHKQPQADVGAGILSTEL